MDLASGRDLDLDMIENANQVGDRALKNSKPNLGSDLGGDGDSNSELCCSDVGMTL